MMQQALLQAKKAFETDEVPVGAVIVDSISKEILAQSHNLTENLQDATAHAEMLAIQAACKKKGSKYLNDCDIYVTLEPCPMCAQAISFARIRRIYFGAYDSKSGGVEHGARVLNATSCHHTPEIIGGIEETQCAQLLKAFFVLKRVDKENLK